MCPIMKEKVISTAKFTFALDIKEMALTDFACTWLDEVELSEELMVNVLAGGKDKQGVCR